MKDLMKYTNLETIVYEYINQANLPNAAFLRLWPIAVRGFKDLFRTTTSEIVTRKLTVMPNKTVALPADYDKLLKIGILNEDGQLLFLVQDRGLSSYAPLDPNRIALNIGSVSGTHDYENVFRNYYNGRSVLNLYGVPYGTAYYGSYKLDEENGIILLSSDTSSTDVFIEYRVNPVANNDFRISDIASDALIAWLAWKDISHVAPGRRSNPTMVAQRRRDYFLEKKRLSSKESAPPLHQLSEIFLKGNSLAAKY